MQRTVVVEQPGSADCDGALIERVLGGDDKAFTMLFRRHQPTLSRRLKRVLMDPAAVEDVVQMTFVHAHRRLGDFDRNRPFAPWLGGIAFRITANHLRSERRRRGLRLGGDATIATTAASGTHAETHAHARQLAALLHEALVDVGSDKRIAFCLHEIEGLGFTEIGELVGASPQTVRARVVAARKQVRKRVGKLARKHELDRSALLAPSPVEPQP